MLTKCRKGEDYIVKEGDLVEVRKGKRVVYSFKARYDMCFAMLKRYMTFKADINLDDEDISYKIRHVRG